MAKAVKVFNGQVTNSTGFTTVVNTTLYTVPAGRVAKVSVSYFYRSTGTTASTFSVGNYSASQTDGGGVPAFSQSATDAPLMLGAGALIHGAGGRVAVSPANCTVWPSDIYLIAGQTVIVGLPGQSSTTTSFTYSFVVVEEY